jgi:tetratricopeptide (TPR) repeat protein
MGQKVQDYQYYDSVTYSLYLSGKWNELIDLGQDAINKGFDYKYLRQRIGYARFISGDYYKSSKDFEKALSFDSYDQFTLEYLYYSYLNTGKEDFSGIIVKRLGPQLKKSLDIVSYKPLESIDLEYNYKYSGTSYRSNPQYYRIGFGTKLGYRLSLFQSVSDYSQDIELQQTGINEVYSNRQTEYYSQLKMQAGSHLTAKAAYHFLYNRSGTTLLKGNMFLFAIAPDLKRVLIELSGSVLNFGQQNTIQTGLLAGYVFPGRSDFYLSSTVSGLFQSQSADLIFSQKAGLRMFKKVWIEGNATLGRMTNYNDFSGLYIFNSIDPMTLKSGITGYVPMNKKIILWANYSWEKKEFYEDNSFHYNQFSYLGGIRWKL